MLRVAVRIWSSVPGTLLLYGAAGIHVALAFLALYERRTLRMPLMEIVRYVLGFAIPLLLITHVTRTRVAAEPGREPGLRTRRLADRAVGRGMAAAAAADRGVDPRDDRGVHLAPAQAVVQPLVAHLVCARLPRSRACCIRLLRDDEGARGASENPTFAAVQQAYREELDVAQRDALEQTRDLWFYGYIALFAAVLLARQVRAVLARRRGSSRDADLPRPCRPGSAGLHGARGEPCASHSPPFALWWARALLDLPGPGRAARCVPAPHR